MSTQTPDISAAFNEELGRMPLCVLHLAPAELLHIITMLQLALRHPGFRDPTPDDPNAMHAAQFVSHFIASIQAGLHEYPTVAAVIEYNGRGKERPRPC